MARSVRVITKTVPWARLLQVAKAAPLVKRHWDMLTPEERRELQRLVLKSKGKPSNLTVTERLAVRRLTRKLELRELGRGLASIPSPVPSRRRKSGR